MGGGEIKRKEKESEREEEKMQRETEREEERRRHKREREREGGRYFLSTAPRNTNERGFVVVSTVYVRETPTVRTFGPSSIKIH